jgi:hypothetical protein
MGAYCQSKDRPIPARSSKDDCFGIGDRVWVGGEVFFRNTMELTYDSEDSRNE